jgi:hypothetical protein
MVIHERERERGALGQSIWLSFQFDCFLQQNKPSDDHQPSSLKRKKRKVDKTFIVSIFPMALGFLARRDVSFSDSLWLDQYGRLSLRTQSLLHSQTFLSFPPSHQLTL